MHSIGAKGQTWQSHQACMSMSSSLHANVTRHQYMTPYRHSKMAQITQQRVNDSHPKVHKGGMAEDSTRLGKGPKQAWQRAAADRVPLSKPNMAEGWIRQSRGSKQVLQSGQTRSGRGCKSIYHVDLGTAQLSRRHCGKVRQIRQSG